MDAGYVEGEHLARRRTRAGKHGPGFDAGSFAFDWAARQATCPQGQTSVTWSQTGDSRRAPAINIRFPQAACAVCPCRDQCTRATKAGRELTVRPEAEHLALQAARARQREPGFQALYARRAGIEGTHSQGTRRCGLRQAHYVGEAKTHLQHLLIAVALNVVRLAAWCAGHLHAHTRQSAFAALTPATT